MQTHTSQIEARLTELGKIVQSFGSDDDVKEILRVIHRPGWTTPAEAQLVLGLIDATIANVKQATHLRQTLLNCSKAVGTSSPVGVN